MAEPAIKYKDFADNYPADYEIDYVVQRTTLVINQIVVDKNYIDNFDETYEGRVLSDTIQYINATGGKLSAGDDFREIDMAIADISTKGIRIPEIPKLKNYLSNFPDLIEILSAVCNLTRERFPHNAQLSLEIDRDIQGNDELILYVRQDHYEDNIMEIIDEIRTTYSHKLISKKGGLLVTTDFASPA